MNNVRFEGLNVHAQTIVVVVAVTVANGEMRSLGIVPNRPGSVLRLLGQLGQHAGSRFYCDVGPTGYVLYWDLSEISVACAVVAATQIPVKSGDWVKTDRRDPAKLTKCYRARQLTPVRDLDRAHEALRVLVRGRPVAGRDQLRIPHRLSNFLLPHCRRPPELTSGWNLKDLVRVCTNMQLEEPAQNAALLDYLHEVEHAAARITRLDQLTD